MTYYRDGQCLTLWLWLCPFAQALGQTYKGLLGLTRILAKAPHKWKTLVGSQTPYDTPSLTASGIMVQGHSALSIKGCEPKASLPPLQ